MHEIEIDLQKLEEILEHQKNLDVTQKGAQPSLCLGCFKGVIIHNIKHREKESININSEEDWKNYIAKNRYFPSENLCKNCQASYTCKSYKFTVEVRKDPFSGRRTGVY